MPLGSEAKNGGKSGRDLAEILFGGGGLGLKSTLESPPMADSLPGPCPPGVG
jgi:hypothetical protein